MNIGLESMAVQSFWSSLLLLVVAWNAADATCLADEPVDEKSPATQAEAQPEAKRSRPESLKFKVVKSSDGSPVADARIDVHLYGRPVNINQDLMTNGDGEATFEYPDGSEPVYLWAMVHHSALVPYYVNFGRNLIPASLPTEKAIRMDPGKTIGGIIVDPDGKPVAGATLSILTPATDTPSEIHYHLLYDHSKEDGTWSFDGAPLNAASLHLSIEHPRFIRAGHRVEDRLDARYIIDPGLRLTGKIIDTDGKPIPTAHVTVGRDRWGSSREPIRLADDGTYTVYALKPQSTWVTAEAPGYSPQIQTVDLDSKTLPIDFKLAAGHTTQFQIVDTAGEPIVGAWIVADTWNGFRSLWWRGNSDAKGLVTWNGAPADAVEFDIGGKDGNDYAAVRNFVAVPQDDPHVIVLKRCLRIEGTVTGNKNQKIPEFRVEIGRKLRNDDDITWLSHDASAGRNGKFQIKYNESCEAIYLRIEAEGFRPWRSEAIPFDETDHKLFVKLEAGEGLSGVLLTPDGQPAAGAKLSLSTARQRMQFVAGYRAIGAKQTVTADRQGNFRFLNVEEESLIAAVHESGYAEVTDKQIAEASEIRLQPWARIEAVVRRGKQLHGSAKVNVHFDAKGPQQLQLFSYGIEGSTDAEGRVTFDRVVPRDGMLALIRSRPIGSGIMNHVERSTRVSLEPGKTAHVEIGGSGAEVVGRLSVKGDPPYPHTWSLNDVIMVRTIAGPSDSGNGQFYQCFIDKDGSFRLYDMPAGRYELQVPLTATPSSDQPSTGLRLGIIRHEFEVPAGDATVDLGVIQGAWDKRLGPGESVPSFVATGIGRDAVRLSDFHGKMLLIDFWSSSSSASMSAMPQLEKLQKKFADESRVQILALSVDNNLGEAEQTVTAKQWGWVNAFAGPGIQSTTASKFDLMLLPEKFLIDVDRKILYRGRDLNTIETLILKRLSDWPAEISKTTSSHGVSPVSIDDNFAAGEAVSLVMAQDNVEYKRPDSVLNGTGFKFWSETGQEIRKLDEIGTSGWLSGPQRVAADAPRNRIYLCDTFHRRLIALDRSGRQLFASSIPGLHAAAVDEATGDIWCVALSNLNAGELVVLDSTGLEKTRHPIFGFGIAFSPADDAFWIAGSSIAKVNRDGKTLSSHALPAGRYTFTEIAVDRQHGGAWVLEDDHPDIPRSRTQLWKAEPDGSAKATHHFEQPIVPRTLVSVDGKPRLAVTRKNPAQARESNSTPNYEIMRFDAAGHFADSLPIPAIDLAVGIQSGTIWVQTDSRILKINQNGQTQLSIPDSAGLKCVQILAF